MLRAVSFAIGVVCAHAYPYFGGLIPNGRNVTGCDGSPVLGVGHIRPSGGGPRNAFGLDWAAAGFTWTVELCNKDSDGDGMTNGQELGDPDCVWTPENEFFTEGVTHPGQNCLPPTPTPAPTTAPTPPPTPAPTCEVAESNRMECGFYGIDEAGCIDRGCCWRSSGTQGVPWCYAKETSPPVGQCQVPENEKQDCGFSGITQDGCEGVKNCCWEESQQPGVPWCFYRAQTSFSSSFLQNAHKKFVGRPQCSRDVCKEVPLHAHAKHSKARTQVCRKVQIRC